MKTGSSNGLTCRTTPPFPLSPYFGCSNCTMQFTDYVMFHMGKFTVLTSYKYNKCSSDQKKALKQAVSDANEIAYAGIKVIAVPGAAPRDWIDFAMKLLSIILVLPSKMVVNSGRYIVSLSSGRIKIWNLIKHLLMLSATLTRASNAYRGWGWSDWW